MPRVFDVQRKTAQGDLSTRGDFTVHGVLSVALTVVTAIAAMRPQWLLGLNLVCMTRTLLHLNCPFCGMTRDFVAILHGRPPLLNPFSWLAVLTIYGVYPAVVLFAVLKRRFDLFHQPALYRLVAVCLLVMFVVNNLPR